MTTRHRCGCRTNTGVGPLARLEFCPLHALAPAMLAWLKQHVRNADCTCHDLGGDGLRCDVCEARAIIARIEGRPATA